MTARIGAVLTLILSSAFGRLAQIPQDGVGILGWDPRGPKFADGTQDGTARLGPALVRMSVSGAAIRTGVLLKMVSRDSRFLALARGVLFGRASD
jgi:hypothetical protein